MNPKFREVSDDELERRLKSLLGQELSAQADFLEHLAEFDSRALPRRKARASLWAYCTRTLGLTESEAWIRVQACRAADRVRPSYTYLKEGRLTISALARLNRCLTPENAEELIKRAVDKSVREVEILVAEVAPRPDIRDRVQYLSAQQAVCSPAPQTEGDTLILSSEAPAAPVTARVHFGFTGSEELRQKVERAKQLLWHKFPEGRLEEVIGQALDDLLDKRDPGHQKEPKRPKLDPAAEEQHKRYIPVWVRAEVWKRDGGCCAYTTSDGVRCGERSALEYDHVIAWALGGPSDEPDNIRLLCRAHNQLLARETFGEKAAGRAAA